MDNIVEKFGECKNTGKMIALLLKSFYSARKENDGIDQEKVKLTDSITAYDVNTAIDMGILDPKGRSRVTVGYGYQYVPRNEWVEFVVIPEDNALIFELGKFEGECNDEGLPIPTFKRDYLIDNPEEAFKLAQ